MPFKFFNIGKANEEITRLENEVTRLNAELVTEKENAAAIIADAEKASASTAKVSELEAKLTQSASDLNTAKASIQSITKERDELKATLEKPDSEIEKRASARALELAAKQGVTGAIELKGATETLSTDPKAEISKLSGLEKAIAAHKLSQNPK